MPRWITYPQLAWASRHLNPAEYAAARKFFPGQLLPEGEYIDGQTGETIVIWQSGQTVPDGTVYISWDSLRDLGVLA